MGLRRAAVIALALSGIAVAEGSDDELIARISGVRYPPLAAAAQVRGDIHLHVNSGTVTLVSGPPLLVRTAVDNAKLLGVLRGRTEFDVTYHFVLILAKTVPRSTTIKRGDALDRAILRMFGLKTEKVVVEYQCEEAVAPANTIKVSDEVEVWIYGSGHCIMTETGTLIARR